MDLALAILEAAVWLAFASDPESRDRRAIRRGQELPD